MLDLESAPDKPVAREIAAYGPRINSQGTGRPSALTDEVGAKIIDAIRQGSFIKPACEAAGTSYDNCNEWLRRGISDTHAELDTRFSRFYRAFTQAQADHQVELAATFTRGGDGKYPDWRAQAFLVERRYEHWRLPRETASSGLTLQLSNEQLAALSDALRVAGARTIELEPEPQPVVVTKANV